MRPRLICDDLGMVRRVLLKPLAVALGVSLVCSLVVTSAAVLLEERQIHNLRLERIRHVLDLAGVEIGGADPFKVYREQITPVLVDLRSARKVTPADLPGFLHPDTFDFMAAARNPAFGEAISATAIGLNRRPRYLPVYFVHDPRGGVRRIILPIVGKGLWSTLYGYLALEPDLTTIAGIRFYQHGETPGLGGEIANPRWQATWRGRLAFDAAGRVAIRVTKGADPASPYQVDALAGATLTSRGVDRMVRYWLGAEGYGPFLQRLRANG